MVKKTKEKKIKELKDKYKGALTEFIYKWFLKLNSEEEDEIFWKNNTPEDVEKQLLESDLI